MSPQPAAVRSSLCWLFADRLMRLVATVPVALLVARSLGPDDFGRLGVALGLSGIGIFMTQLGLDRVLRRDIAECPADAGRLVGTAAVLALGAAMLAVAAISTYAIEVIADPAARRVVLILAWGAVPQVLAPAEAWFQSAEHPRKAVIVRTAVVVLAAVLRVVGCVQGWPVMTFALVTLVEWTVTAAAIALLFLSHRQAPTGLGFSGAVAGRWIREVWPMFLMLIVGASLERFDLLVLQRLAPPPETGYFAAAQRMSELWWSLSVTAAVAALPWLSRQRAGARPRFLGAMQKYFDVSMAATLAVAIGVTLVAPFVLPALLGAEYAASVPVLIALCWAAPAVYAEVARSQYLLLERKVHIDVAFNLTHAAVGTALCVWSVPKWGASGAATARLCGFALVAWVFPWCVPATREIARLQWRSFFFYRRWDDLQALVMSFFDRPRAGADQAQPAISPTTARYWRTMRSTVNWFSTLRRAATPSAARRLSSRSKA